MFSKNDRVRIKSDSKFVNPKFVGKLGTVTGLVFDTMVSVTLDGISVPDGLQHLLGDTVIFGLSEVELIENT